MNKYIENRSKERYMRFEKTVDATKKFWEIWVSNQFIVWLCEGAIGSEGTNSVLSGTEWGSLDGGSNMKKASALVDAKLKAGFIYIGEIKKVVDTRYKNALISQNPQDLLDCLHDGYSPFAAVDANGAVKSAMEIAIAGGHLESIRTLVMAGCDIDILPEWLEYKFKPSGSPLRFALEYTKDAKIVQFILDLGADINKCSGQESKTPLQVAGSVELIKIICENGANVDAVNAYGDTALSKILLDSNGCPDIKLVSALINHKADINKKCRNANPPLIEAAMWGKHEAVELMLANGADLSACDRDGANALVKAVWRFDEARTKTIQILLNAGADPNSSMRGGVTALMVAADSAAVANIKLLVAAGADINAKDRKGKTALMRVTGTNASMVKSLIKAGATLDIKHNTGKTAVMYAAESPGHGEKWKSASLKVLIAAGADLAIEDSSGRGPLQTHSSEAAMILLSAGAVPNAVDGESLMGLAIASRNLALALKVLEKCLCNIKPSITNNKWNLSAILDEIGVANPLLLSRLTSHDADIRGLLDGYQKKALSAVATEYVHEDDLPAILKPGAWPGVGKGKAPPNLPSFWNALIHPSPRLLSNPKPMPPDAIDVIARMVLMSTHDAPIPAIAQVQAACDRQSLANFALSIFHEWADKGSKATDGLFQVLGYWGDGKAAKTLTPLIQHWPMVQLSQRAAMGLEILETMGRDIALMQIQAIATKTKYDSLRLRAEALLKKVAATRNLSAEQLEDRLVPSFDLSDDGALRLDFGSRYFVVGVDEQLHPILKDAHGNAIKALPKASPADDVSLAAQSSEKWREFKKDIKPVATLQLSRLEQAMSNSRRWAGDDFINLLVNHPLLRKAVRGLVWAAYDKKNPVSTFAFRPDGTAVDVNGIAFVVKPDARVGVPHPLDMRADLAAWMDVFQQTKQAQPFPQLVRKVYVKDSDLDGTLFGLQGLVVPSLSFKGLKAMGWERDGETFGGTFYSFDRRFPSGSASINVTPGLNLAAYDTLASEQTLSVDFAGLAPVDFSELIRELQILKA